MIKPPDIPTPGVIFVYGLGVVNITSQSPIVVGAVSMDLTNGAYNDGFVVTAN